MKNHIPYTYLIGWSNLNTWYYGVRYAKGCNPNDLWVTYFTSSKHVKKFREEYGEPNIISIRRTFNSKDKALLWEQKVLIRLDVIHRPNWLNKTNNRAIIYDRTQETLYKFSSKMKGRKSPFKDKRHTHQSKQKMSENSKGKSTGRTSEVFTQDWKNKISKSKKGYVRDQSYNEKQHRSEKAILNKFGQINKGKVWINNGIKNRRVYPDELFNFPEYTLGRLSIK